ncbi:MAG TPA: glycosyltransferase family 2 protein [Terriglobia bacterium]|nr:glycosyltransferase family 2 protein [Terriglobia bacterium]
MRPFLSVLIDTYNHEKYIEQAMLSAVEQDFPANEYEIVVVDDGSSDRTPDIVRKFEPRVRLLRKKNGGQASAYNFGASQLRGEAVAFLDGDDWFAPGKLGTVMEALEKHPEAAAVGHGFYEVKEQAGEIEAHAARQTILLTLETPLAAHEALLAVPFLHNAALTLRRRVLDRVIPIPEVLRFCADAPLAIASMSMGLLLLGRPLHYYRVHGNNLYASVDPANLLAARRKCEIEQIMFKELETLLLREGVRRDSVEALLYPWWVDCNRSSLRFGGKRAWAFQTEMRSFRFEHPNATAGYSLFKYLVVGIAALTLGPRVFYRCRDWYGRRDLRRVRERLVGGA